MGRIHLESSDSWTLDKPNADTSNTVSLEQGGIQQAWAEIETRKKLEKKKSQVLLEGYVETAKSLTDDLTSAKSLTDDDLEELKGCLDLGFGFSYDEIPELCNTLPALELCYSMSQKFLDDNKHNHLKSPEVSSVEEDSSPPRPTTTTTTTTPIANWKFSSPEQELVEPEESTEDLSLQE